MYPVHSHYYNGQYMPNPYDCPMSAYVPPCPSQASQPNQIYVNQSFVHAATVSNTVLVNPNFTRQVHVNPNFASKNVKMQPNTVFVNPNVFNKAGASKVQSSTTKATNPIQTPAMNSIKTQAFASGANAAIATKYLKINNYATTKRNILPIVSRPNTRVTVSSVKSSYKVNHLVNDRKVAIVKTKTKLIRVQSTQSKVTANALINNNKKIDRRSITTQQMSYKPKQIISMHKLVRNNTGLKSIVKTKYKLVRSANALPKSPRIKQLRKVSISMLNAPSSNRFKLDNRIRRQSECIIRSPYKLTKKAYMMRLDPQNSIIKNTKFKLIRSSDKKMKVQITKKIEEKRSPLIRKKKFTKRNLVKINKKKLQKNNIPCEMYNKRGVCKGLASGKCAKKHDPNQIQICIWFLQGICRDDKCTLSHKASPEKMPTCKFYLEGICIKDSCPYLHVKLNRDAPVCRDFLNGYCAKAHECDKRHQFLCPDFERDGKCSRKLCRYPHGKAVRQYKDTLLNVIARNRKSKTQRKGKSQKAPKTESKPDDTDIIDTKRYYDCPAGAGSKLEQPAEEGKLAKVDSEDSSSTTTTSSIFDRPKLGSLPSFISL